MEYSCVVMIEQYPNIQLKGVFPKPKNLKAVQYSSAVMNETQQIECQKEERSSVGCTNFIESVSSWTSLRGGGTWKKTVEKSRLGNYN